MDMMRTLLCLLVVLAGCSSVDSGNLQPLTIRVINQTADTIHANGQGINAVDQAAPPWLTTCLRWSVLYDGRTYLVISATEVLATVGALSPDTPHHWTITASGERALASNTTTIASDGC
jgi:hypothetical protein